MRCVIVESPYGDDDPEVVKRNEAYARACLADCLKRGEAPFASHLLYTQPGVLNDNDPEERMRGIEAGLAIGEKMDITAVYEDLGVSGGMQLGINRADSEGRLVERRRLGGVWTA